MSKSYTKDQIEKLKSELKIITEERDYLKRCCIDTGIELSKRSFKWDGKEKNLVVQALQLNEMYEELKAENERLKENYIKLSQQKDLDSTRWVKRCTDLHIEDKSIADKYWLTLQEIKKYCEKCKDCVEVGDEVILYTIIQKIEKVEDNQ